MWAGRSATLQSGLQGGIKDSWSKGRGDADRSRWLVTFSIAFSTDVSSSHEVPVSWVTLRAFSLGSGCGDRAAAGPALHPLCSLAMCLGWAAVLSPPAPCTAWLSSWAGPRAWTWVRGQRPHWAAPSLCNGSDQWVCGST